jgi:hypothetical protein
MAARVTALACGVLLAGFGATAPSGAHTALRSYPLSHARSLLFAGYQASPGKRISTDVSATYRLRPVQCAPTGDQQVVMLVGASGRHAGTRWAYQAGTSAFCHDGVATYGIWYRRGGDPADLGRRYYLSTDLRPGGRISVEITLNSALPPDERSSIYLVWPGAAHSRVIVGPVPGESDRQTCGVSRVVRQAATSVGAPTGPAAAARGAARTYPVPSFPPQNVTCSFRGVNQDESPQAGVASYSIPIARVDMVGPHRRPLAVAQEPVRPHGGLERLVWLPAR